MTRPWIGFDVETSGTLPEFALQPWRVKQGKAWLTTAAFARRKKNGDLVSDGVIYPTREWLAAFLEKAAETGSRIVTWNGTFDIAWLYAYGLGKLVERCLWLDGMRAWKHLDITNSEALNHSYALKGPDGAVGHFAPGMGAYEEGVDYHSQDPAELEKLLGYNKLDTVATLVAVERIFEKLEQRQRGVLLCESACLPMVARANLRGMQVNRKATVALNAKMVSTVEAMRAALEEHGVTETVIRSPKQLSAAIFDNWGLPDPSGKRSTAKDVLSELVIVDDRVALLQKFREALNLKSKFIDGIVKSCEYNGDRITRPQCNVFGTYTGRMTYNGSFGRKGTKAERQVGFALHQMKRGKDWRSLIVAPEGYEIVEFDAAGQEFRWMAIQSGDETMLGLCLPGEDPHSYMAAEIHNRDYEEVRRLARADDPAIKPVRQGGKVANLSLQYRTSARTLRIRARTDHNLILSEQEAVRIHRTYQRAYPGVPKYWTLQIARGRRLGYAETVAGRRVQVPGNWGGPFAWNMESTMINYPIQGTGGDQKYLALSVLKNRLPEYDAQFAWDLHDGIYFYVPTDKAQKFAVEMKEVLDNLPYKRAWDFVPPIPMPWDAHRGPSWGELKGVEA